MFSKNIRIIRFLLAFLFFLLTNPLPAQLSVSAFSSGGGTVGAGDQVAFTISARNTSGGPLTNVTISNPVPPNTAAVPGSTVVRYPIAASGTLADSFTAFTFQNSSGTLPWRDPWVDFGSGEGGNFPAEDGNVAVIYDGTDARLRIRQTNRGAYRMAYLLGASSATLSYRYRREGDWSTVCQFQVQAAPTPSGPWTTLASYLGNATPDSMTAQAPLSLLPHASATTTIRFICTASGSSTRQFFVDDVVITLTGRYPHDFLGGDPPNLATGITLLSNETASATFDLTIDSPFPAISVTNNVSATADSIGIFATMSIDNVVNMVRYRVFKDLDGDGIEDVGEPGQADSVVLVTDSTNTTTQQVTDANGVLRLYNLPAGNTTFTIERSDQRLPVRQMPSVGAFVQTVDVPAHAEMTVVPTTGLYVYPDGYALDWSDYFDRFAPFGGWPYTVEPGGNSGALNASFPAGGGNVLITFEPIEGDADPLTLVNTLDTVVGGVRDGLIDQLFLADFKEWGYATRRIPYLSISKSTRGTPMEGDHVRMTVEFTHPNGARYVAFNLYDVDRQNNGATPGWVDRVVIEGERLDGSTFPATIFGVAGHSNVDIGTPGIAGGLASIGDANTPLWTTGHVRVNFGNETIRRFRVTYENQSPPAVYGGLQGIGLSRIEFFAGSGPLLAILGRFDATRLADERVQLDWTTIEEVGNLGFRIMRSDNGSVTRLMTPGLIPGQIDSQNSAVYTWINEQPMNPGEVRNYYLVDVDLSGFETWHGPVTIDGTSTRPTTVGDWSIYR